ncbi:hypothetical protein PoB_003018100 [Plakobranchus ocellatus]|uniref:Uncharacterized protein n=1 Tax=Plakobranchus ocellatus TaxID=259542 RepID=A0AAV4AAM5_9GAST|nr:hypothetical protein PoB_003018100 [Plakobranchus ocellatus]
MFASTSECLPVSTTPVSDYHNRPVHSSAEDDSGFTPLAARRPASSLSTAELRDLPVTLPALRTLCADPARPRTALDGPAPLALYAPPPRATVARVSPQSPDPFRTFLPFNVC